MKLGPLAFPGWTAIVAGAACAAGIALGNWQSGRAAEKLAVAERIAAQAQAAPVKLGAAPAQRGAADGAAHDLLWRRVEARGEFDAARTLYLANRLHRGQPGYHVVSPLRVENGSRYVLVLRGWLPSRGSAPPEHAVPGGMRTVRGLAVPAVARVYESGEPGRERVRQNVDLDGFGRETGFALYPFFIEQRDGATEGLVQDWPAHDARLDTHRMYALQWYVLAALAPAIFFTLSYRHGRRRDAA